MGPVAMAVGAGVGGLAGAAASIFGSDKQADAAKQAAKVQRQMYNTTRGDLLPFQQFGIQSKNMLMGQLGDLTKPFSMTQEQLEQTPGYQFTLAEGLKATQNSYAAQGLGSSGAAMKGAAQYATGLASTTFQQQLQNYLAQNMQRYNMLMGGAQLGENAAAQTGSFGTQAGANIGNSLMSAGNAQAAGMVGAANSFSGGVNNAIMNYYQADLTNKLMDKIG